MSRRHARFPAGGGRVGVRGAARPEGRRRRTSRRRRSRQARSRSSRIARHRHRRRCRGSSSGTRGWRWRGWRRSSSAHPSREMQVVGITGTNGKTTTGLSGELDLRGCRHAMRPDGNRDVSDRRTGVCRDADDARGAGAAGDDARDGERRLRRVRHGGVVACAGAAPRRQHSFRGGDLHQPDARPSRLPR